MSNFAEDLRRFARNHPSSRLSTDLNPRPGHPVQVELLPPVDRVAGLPEPVHERVELRPGRPHAHAAERIGFLYGRLVPGEPLIVMIRYVPVPDEQYVVDDTVGARINGDAIRAAMQGVLDTGDGVFHTHLHEWPGTPEFSPTDDEEMPRLIPAFRAVGPTQAAGLFLLSPDSVIADVWLPGTPGPERAASILIVE